MLYITTLLKWREVIRLKWRNFSLVLIMVSPWCMINSIDVALKYEYKSSMGERGRFLMSSKQPLFPDKTKRFL